MTKPKKHQEQQNHARACKQTIEVAFVLEQAAAREIFLCGEFNQWSPSAVRMIRTGGNGRWEKRVTLAPGRYEYKFVVDGEWMPDPRGQENVVNPFGSTNSVIQVK